MPIATSGPPIAVTTVDFNRRRDDIYRVRTTVFVAEQGVPRDVEHDALDPLSLHILATVDGEVVGTGRLTPRGHIGRMAVLGPFRGRGVGRRMLRHLINEARKRGLTELTLAAQTHAITFYEASGFHPEGAVFQQAGIDHRRMRLSLAHSPGGTDPSPSGH